MKCGQPFWMSGECSCVESHRNGNNCEGRVRKLCGDSFVESTNNCA